MSDRLTSQRRYSVHVPMLVGRITYPKHNEDAKEVSRRLVGEFDTVMQELQRFLHYMQDGSDIVVTAGSFDPDTPEIVDMVAGDRGDPTKGWSPGPHRHQVRSGAPSGLGNAPVTGVGPSLSPNDHVHKRDVRAKKTGVDVATRNALDFRDTATVTFAVADDVGNDEVDVSATVLPFVVVPATPWSKLFMVMGC